MSTPETPPAVTKICTGCHQPFPLTRDFFYVSRQSATGFQSRCKDCDNDRPLEERGLTRDQVRSRRKYDVRKHTLNVAREPKRVRLQLAQEEPDTDHDRPRTREECENSVRPCPFVGCRYHLYLDVTASGNITLNFPDLEPEQLVDSCSLDVAEHGGETLEVVGALLNITRERVRQLEARAVQRLANKPWRTSELRELYELSLEREAERDRGDVW